jgi:conjugal transfer pilus assembly protein TraV
MNTLPHRRHLWLTSSLGLCGLLGLSGCAALGGNIRGDFSCAAPDGICAPSSTIDDRALAIISAEGVEGEVLSTAGTPRSPTVRGDRTVAGPTPRMAAADTSRTSEKVLRIVFQPYIDERGRLHEASAVHAVVATGEWQQALQQPAAAGAPPVLGLRGSPETLADAVDRSDPPGAAGDPDAPDPAAVAAARARKLDPVEAIRADVAARLTPKAGGAPAAATADGTAHPSSAAVSPAPPSPVGAPASDGSGVLPRAEKPQADASAAGAQAVERVKADPVYRGIAGSVARGARDAAAQNGAAPAAPSPTVRAPNFPATVQEEN